jgi:hypothetical protein
MAHGNAGQQRRDAYSWYRHERAYKLRQMGLTYACVAQLLGISSERARQLVEYYEWAVVRG